MPYEQEISRQNKGCFLFLLDQSYSMEEPLGGTTQRKCDQLALAINAWLFNIGIRASGDSGVRDWLDIGVLGYRTDPQANPIIEPGLQGSLAGKPLVSIVEIAANPARIDQVTRRVPDEETGELIEIPEQMPVWIDPKAEGGTPMCQTLHDACHILDEWIGSHPKSFPPVVINITDGESADGDPIPYADVLKERCTEDGNVLFFNCHLSMTAADPFMFKSNGEILPDKLARDLFNMSSVLPETIYNRAKADGFDLEPNARGMAFNADMVQLIRFLDMGTRVAAPTNLR